LTVNNAINSSFELLQGYTLSTLRISQTANDPNPIFLYDKLVQDGFIIGANNSEYSRENLDVVGSVLFNFTTTSFRIFANLSAFTTPAVGAIFAPSTRHNAVFMYVRATGDLNDLGRVTGFYGGGGNFAYFSGFDSNGNYVPGRSYQNQNSTGVVSFGTTGVSATMTANNAWAAVERVTINGKEELRVISDRNSADYFIFLVGMSNGQSTIDRIQFEYIPQAVTEQELTAIQSVDFLSSVGDVLDIVPPAVYEFSFVNFSYTLTGTQQLEVITNRLNITTFEFLIDYTILDQSSFFMDILNIKGRTIIIIYNNTTLYNGTNQGIELRFAPNGDITVAVRNFST
jgi:hypothetical protein